MNNDKLKAKIELQNALIQLRTAWINTLHAMSNIDIDCNDYIIDKYPFEESFDDIDVIDWIDESCEKLELDIDVIFFPQFLYQLFDMLMLIVKLFASFFYLVQLIVLNMLVAHTLLAFQDMTNQPFPDSKRLMQMDQLNHHQFLVVFPIKLH